MNASAGYLNFKFDKFMGSCDAFVKMTTGQQICDYSGKGNIFTPSLTAATSVEYYKSISDSLAMRITLDANYRGAQYVEASLNNDIKQKEVVKLNARIAFEGESFSLALLGKNLTNVHRATYITDTPLSGMAVLNTPAYTAYMDRPRSISVQFGYRF